MLKLSRLALYTAGVWVYWVVLLEPLNTFFTRLGHGMGGLLGN